MSSQCRARSAAACTSRTSHSSMHQLLVPGVRVKIFSQTERCWCAGFVVDPVYPGKISVEFRFPDGVMARKNVHPGSNDVVYRNLHEIDPETNWYNPFEWGTGIYADCVTPATDRFVDEYVFAPGGCLGEDMGRRQYDCGPFGKATNTDFAKGAARTAACGAMAGGSVVACHAGAAAAFPAATAAVYHAVGSFPVVGGAAAHLFPNPAGVDPTAPFLSCAKWTAVAAGGDRFAHR